MDSSEKRPNITGMIEGLKFRDGPMGPWNAATKDLSIYIKRVNGYYAESENLNIPVVLMFDVFNTDINDSWENNQEKAFRLEFLRENSEDGQQG